MNKIILSSYFGMKKVIIIFSLAAVLLQIANCQEIHVYLNDFYSVKLKQISESEYTAQMKASEHLRHKPYKAVTDVTKAKKMLGKKLKNVNIQAENDTHSVVEITFKDKTKKRLDWCNLENGFVAYYPKCNVLCFRSEDDSDYPIDLNGSSRWASNPANWVVSPDKKLLISGKYNNAAGAMGYYIEQWNKSKKKYEHVADLRGANNEFYFGNINNYFWTSNNIALFKDGWGDYVLFYEMEIIETLQAQQPRYTEFRTAEEKDSCTWYHKITTVETLKNHYIQLVTSSPDCHTEWVCVQMIDKTTGKLVQTIDLTDYDSGGYEWITVGDYNFDGYDDFYLTAGVDKWGTGGYGYYFFYDPITGTFIASEELNALGKCEFTDDRTVIQRNVWTDDNGKIQAEINEYRYIDNKLTLISSEKYIDNEEEFGIDLNEAQDLYRRLNSGQLLPGDLELLEYLQQQYIEDSLVIRKTFNDKNGKNQLEVVVINPCLQLKEFEEAVMSDNWRKYYRVDGWINYITVSLNNKNYSDTMIYYHPGVAMSLIHLLERNITLKTISGKQAVFIPFAYCGTGDDDIQITCIVLYDHQKYLYPINLQGADFQNYKIVDDLNEKFEDLPKKLKKELIKHINSQYKTVF